MSMGAAFGNTNPVPVACPYDIDNTRQPAIFGPADDESSEGYASAMQRGGSTSCHVFTSTSLPTDGN